MINAFFRFVRFVMYSYVKAPVYWFSRFYNPFVSRSKLKERVKRPAHSQLCKDENDM